MRVEYTATAQSGQDGHLGEVPVAMQWDPTVPYVVTATIGDPDGPDGAEQWDLGREQLHPAAMGGRVWRDGDVHAIPIGMHLVLVLMPHDPDRTFTLALLRSELQQYLAQLARMVPLDREYVDVDGAIARILAGAGS